MKLQEFRKHFNNELSNIYPITEIKSFFFLLIENKLNLQVTDFFINTNLEITPDILVEMYKILDCLKQEEPIQYVLGTTEFYGLDFNVNKNVLIPRSETEELVSWVINDIENKASKNTKIKILDIGTGSGCIPIAIKKNLPNVEVFALDISNDALEIAKENAKLNEVSVNFFTKDILQAETLSNKFDIIISNPPYVRELEKQEIKNNVLQNEPHLALFVDDENPLVFYKKIADLAKKNLTKLGTLYFEINQYLGKETIEMLKQKEFKHIELKKDLFGNDRMIKIMI